MSNDWIQRARDLVYHVTCFCCYVCKRQLLPGETVVAREDFVVCYEHREASLHLDDVDSLSGTRKSYQVQEKPIRYKKDVHEVFEISF